MPEAVSSNSISMPEGQRVRAADLRDNIETAIEALTMLGSFAEDEIEQNSGETVSMGFDHLFRREMETLRRIAKQVSQFEPEIPGVEGPIWVDLYSRIGETFGDILREAWHELDSEDATSWPESIRTLWIRGTIDVYQRVTTKLGGSRDPFLAGSLLPWAELIIRRDLLNEDSTSETMTDRISSIVDRLSASHWGEAVQTATGSDGSAEKRWG